MANPLSVQAKRVVEALGEGRRFVRRPGGWVAGALVAADALVAELGRRDLARVVGDRLALTATGRGRCRPRAEPGPRLLIERALPQDEAHSAGPVAPAATAPRAGARPACSVTVNLAESPLGWLRARGLVDARQFEAGERLRGDWTVAGMAPRVTMRWDAAPVAPCHGPVDRLDPTLAQIAARRRMEASLDAVGPGLRDVLWRIVCAGEGMETAERALGWPARAGRVVLTLALDRLADSYGLA